MIICRRCEWCISALVDVCPVCHSAGTLVQLNEADLDSIREINLSAMNETLTGCSVSARFIRERQRVYAKAATRKQSQVTA